MNRRNRPGPSVIGAQKAMDMAYNDESGGLKVVGQILGDLQPIGAISAIQKTEQGKTIALFNSDTAIHWVKFGDASVAAPTGFADGLPVPPGQYSFFSVGRNCGFRSDSALVFAYVLQDDTTLT